MFLSQPARDGVKKLLNYVESYNIFPELRNIKTDHNALRLTVKTTVLKSMEMRADSERGLQISVKGTYFNFSFL